MEFTMHAMEQLAEDTLVHRDNRNITIIYIMSAVSGLISDSKYSLIMIEFSCPFPPGCRSLNVCMIRVIQLRAFFTGHALPFALGRALWQDHGKGTLAVSQQRPS